MPDVLVVGAGPVGLYTATLLADAGADVLVIETRTERDGHSRAIGIHPPALAALERAGVRSAMVTEGVAIHDGVLRSAGRTWGRLSFEAADGADPFVLSLPQHRSETLLEEALLARAPDALLRGARLRRLLPGDRSVVAEVEGPDGALRLSARLVVGADGSRSTVRTLLGVPGQGRIYPDRYLMGDVRDDTGEESTAVLYFEREGVVECFPLPGGMRRWVVHTGTAVRPPDEHLLARLVAGRTGIGLDLSTCSMVSSFGARRWIAAPRVLDRVVLLGDAAHVVSPIGGQGMNLGWLDAQALVPPLVRALQGTTRRAELAAVLRRRWRSARIAARQAELNMVLGRPYPPPVLRLRNEAIRLAAASPPVRELMARTFTMHGL